jgi:hypothetical protein
MANRSSADESTAARGASSPDLAIPVAADDKVDKGDSRSADLAVRAKDARRKAELSGDTADRVEADDLEAQLVKQGAVPDWKAPDEGVAKATEIVAQFGDGLDADDQGGWANMRRLLGYPLDELEAVSATERGVVWKVKASGAWYIAVGEQSEPDAAGRRGIMLWQAPQQYEGPYPRYSTSATPTPPFVKDAVANIPPQGLPPGF